MEKLQEKYWRLFDIFTLRECHKDICYCNNMKPNADKTRSLFIFNTVNSETLQIELGQFHIILLYHVLVVTRHLDSFHIFKKISFFQYTFLEILFFSILIFSKKKIYSYIPNTCVKRDKIVVTNGPLLVMKDNL